MTTTEELFEAATENSVMADVARRGCIAEQINIIEDRLVGVVVNGELHTYNLDDYLDNPRLAMGHPSLTDHDSFIAYVNRYVDPNTTTLWSNVDQGTVTAVLDDHGITGGTVEGLPGYGRHRATLTLKNSPDWKHWLKNDGRLMKQQEFAEHIEDGAACIVQPEAAAMLELAQSFQANTRVDFESGDRLQSGEVKLTYKETTSARAGHSGSIDIPTMIDLELQVFEAGSTYGIKARFMYRINDGVLTLGYRLIRPDVARKLAFDDITAKVEEGIQLPVLAGAARS